MNKNIIITKRNYVFENYPGKADFQPSQTIPDQTLSIQEIIRRYSRGLPITGNVREPIFDENEIPNLEWMELTDKQDMIQAIRQFEEKERQLKDAQDKLAERKAIIDEYLLENPPPVPPANPGGTPDGQQGGDV